MMSPVWNEATMAFERAARTLQNAEYDLAGGFTLAGDNRVFLNKPFLTVFLLLLFRRLCGYK